VILIKLWLKVLKRNLKPNFFLWILKGFNLPAPQKIKTRILKRNAFKNGNWVETGTYLGDTTKFLARNFPKILITSLEPDLNLYLFNKSRLKRFKNVKLVNGTSENSLREIVLNENDIVNFWLDGHFSGDITYKGKVISPIIEELDIIEQNISRLKVCVFIDDIRDFVGEEKTGYPDKNQLVDWAVRNNLEWRIEMDIFIAKSKA